MSCRVISNRPYMTIASVAEPMTMSPGVMTTANMQMRTITKRRRRDRNSYERIPMPREQVEDDRELECQAEGEQEGGREADVLAQGERRRDARQREVEEEADGNRQQKPSERDPRGEQEDRDEQQRPDHAAFAPGQPGGDEGPDLEQDDRHRQRRGRP